MNEQLLIGIPKGSLQEATFSLFEKAGLRLSGAERSLWLKCSDPQIRPVLLRPQEIPRYVAAGSLDCGLSGLDWIAETGCTDRVRILADLCYSKLSFRPVRWVLAIAESSPWTSVNELSKGQQGPLRISTELKQITESWLAERGIEAEVDLSWGATEAKVPVFADGIVECTETGTSLRANGLRILATVMESTTQFFSNKEVYKVGDWKRAKLDAIAVLLKSRLTAESKVCMRVQCPGSEAGILKALIPSKAGFSQWDGRDGEVLMEVTTEKETGRDLLPVLARNGATRVSVVTPEIVYE